MISHVHEERDAITFSQLFTNNNKRNNVLVKDNKRVYIANTVYIRVVGFSQFIRPNNYKIELNRLVQHQEIPTRGSEKVEKG